MNLSHVLRGLAKTPGFTGVAVLSLALGIGASTAVFSLVNAILLRSLPVPNPHELRVLQWAGTDHKFNRFNGSMERNGPAITADAFSFPLFQTLRASCAAQAELFGYTSVNNVTVRARREPFTAEEGLLVSGNFFGALRARPLLGRPLGPDDDNPGAPPAVVISQAWWEKQFDSAPEVLGTSVALNGHAFTVVGVMPAEFRGVHPGAGTEFYVTTAALPQLLAGSSLTAPNHAWFKLMARLAPGATDASFRAVASAVFAAASADWMKDGRLLVTSGHAGPQWQSRYYRKTLLLLLGIVGLVVVVACANVAGLLLARGAAWQHEFAVRAALGAGRWRLVRQALAESFALAGAGAVLGALIAVPTKAALGRLIAGSAEGLRYDTSLDLTVLGFTAAVALATALLSGLLPALSASRADPLVGLKAAGAVQSPRLRAGRALVVFQIALAVVLFTGAGLYVRTLVNLVRINPGFATENILLFRLNPRAAGLRGAQLAVFHNEVQSALGRIPGARAVALQQYALLGHEMSGGGFFEITNHALKAGEQWDGARLNVSENFFATLQIPIRLGRGLTAADTEGSTRVVVVNDVFVRTYLPGENPLGQTLKIGNALWQIVGVAADTTLLDLKEQPRPTVFFSFRQSSTGAAYFAIRTGLPPLALVEPARKAVAAINPEVPLTAITTQRALRDENVAQERMFALLCSALAALAVALSCLGLYGLMAYNVARRTREIGVRVALGAEPRAVGRLVLREAVVLVLTGLALGGPAAGALTRLIRNQLHGVSPADPATLGVAAFVLAVVAVLAASLPARRATRVNPLEALRAE